MSFSSLIGVELTKIRRSKIFLILLAPVLMMWLPSIINSDMIFDVRGIPITPENNFFIQGFMGMVYDSGVACYLHRPAQSNRANKQRNFENVVPADQHCKDVPCKVYRFDYAGGCADGYGNWGVLRQRCDCHRHAGL